MKILVDELYNFVVYYFFLLAKIINMMFNYRYITEYYQVKMGSNEKVMDFKTEDLANPYSFYKLYSYTRSYDIDVL